MTLTKAGHEVVGESCELNLAEMLSSKPDIVILEGALLVLSDEILRDIRTQRAATKIIVWADPDWLESFTPDADGLIYKDDDCWERFLPAVNCVTKGKQWIDAKVEVVPPPFIKAATTRANSY
ncbi:MAG TPA: hypothetical protein V6C97_31835 [Oculatellaceae cyanobacterium]